MTDRLAGSFAGGKTVGVVDIEWVGRLTSGACPLADALVSVDGPLGSLFNPDCVDAVGEDEGGAEDDAEGAGDLVEEQVSEVGGAGQSGVAEGNRDTEVADSNGQRASVSPSPDFAVCSGALMRVTKFENRYATGHLVVQEADPMGTDPGR